MTQTSYTPTLSPAIFGDRVLEIIVNPGTSNFLLGTPENTFIGFENIPNIADGDNLFYFAEDGSNWEVGFGTFSNVGSTTLQRGPIVSSNGNNLANLIGTVSVGCDITAEWLANITTYISNLNTNISNIGLPTIVSDLENIPNELSLVQQQILQLEQKEQSLGIILRRTWTAGVLFSEQLLVSWILPYDVIIDSNVPNCYAGCENPPLADKNIYLIANGSTLTTISYVPSTYIGTVETLSSITTLSAGTTLSLVGDTNTDATFANPSIALYMERKL